MRSKASHSISNAENDTQQTRNYNSSKRLGGEGSSSHGRHNPFSAVSPLSTNNIASPTVSGASSAFGLGSGAFASFGSSTKTPKSPGNALDFGSSTAPGTSPSPVGEKREREGIRNIATKTSSSSLSNSTSSTPSEHPLKHTWVVWYRPPTSKYSDYEKSTLPLVSFSSVESFWTVYSHLKRPSSLPSVSDYHIFKKGVRPVWEDKENRKGGKWIVRLKKGVADRYWEDLLMAIVGDQFAEAGEEVCGAVLSVRSGEDVLSVWTRIDGGRNIKIRETVKRLLAFPSDTNIMWKSHDDSIAQRSAIEQARLEKSAGSSHQTPERRVIPLPTEIEQVMVDEMQLCRLPSRKLTLHGKSNYRGQVAAKLTRVLRFYSLKTIAATNRAFIVPHEHGLALAYQPLVNADSYLPWRTKCPVRALAGEVDLYMGILNLPSKEPAKAEAEQDIDQAGQTVTNSSPQHTKGVYPRSADERRLFGDFEVGADAEPIPIPTNPPHRDDMNRKVGVEGILKPCNTLRQQNLLSFDTQRHPTRTYERSAGSKRMRTEMARGDNVPHTDELWNLHGDLEYQKRKKIKSRESIVISDDEIATREDTNDMSGLEDTSRQGISLGLEMEVISAPTMNGDVPEFRGLERRMRAGRGGKSSSAKTNTPRFTSQELRKSLPDPSSQFSSSQFEEISDDEVHTSPKAAEPYTGTSFLSAKRPDRTRSRPALQNMKVVRQTDTKSAYFLPTSDQRHASKERPFGRLTNSGSPVNSRDVFKREGAVDDSPDVLHNGGNIGIRNSVRTRDLATTNGHSEPARRSLSPPKESPLSSYRSPNDIRITRFDSPRRKAETSGQVTAKAKNSRSLQEVSFRLKKLVYGQSSLGLGDHEYRLKFDFANGDAKVTFECPCGVPQCSVDLNCLAFPIMKVIRIAWHDTMVQITLCKESNHDNVFLLDFLGGAETLQFVTNLKEVSKCGSVLKKDRDHMEGVFQCSEKQRQAVSSKQHHLRSLPEPRSEMELDQDASRIQHNKERQKLRRDDGQTGTPSTAKRRRSESSECRLSVQQVQQASASDSKVNIFEANYHGTRSRIRSDKINQDLDKWSEGQRLVGKQVPEHRESKFSELKRQHKPWDKPLVFPTNGPKKTTVDFDDLERLDEGEFLNDNIIAFYLRYLERDLEVSHPAIAKRIYFFNTFFYERLTSRSSGKRGINYEGVQKWTSKIDIFNFDYVVVPVNESAHWYVAIICNLPNISRALNQEEREEDWKVEPGVKQNDSVQAAEPSSPHSSRQSTVADAIDLDHGVIEAGEQVARISLIQKETAEETGNLDSNRMLEVSGTENVEDENWPAADENPPVNPADSIPSISQDQAENTNLEEELTRVRIKAQHKSKKAKRRLSLRKYNVDDPVIITLDSLGLTHSITARNLKEYLIEEGKSKRQLRVLIEDISAMNSKEIPLQDNFCDCGIYLLIYIEKFLKDPRSFVSGILRREMDQKSDWPDLNPSVKRDHLRNLLLNLYKEQNDTRRKDAISKGKYHKGLRRATHQGEELSNDLLSREPKGNQRKPELPETDHDASNNEATAYREKVSKVHGISRLEDSLIVVGDHPSEKQSGPALEGDSSSRIELSTNTEMQGDLYDLESLHENTPRRNRKDLTTGVDANVEPTEQPSTEPISSGKPLERFPRRNSKARGVEIAGFEVVVSPRRRTRNRRPSPELNDGSIILD